MKKTVLIAILVTLIGWGQVHASDITLTFTSNDTKTFGEGEILIPDLAPLFSAESDMEKFEESYGYGMYGSNSTRINLYTDDWMHTLYNEKSIDYGYNFTSTYISGHFMTHFYNSYYSYNPIPGTEVSGSGFVYGKFTLRLNNNAPGADTIPVTFTADAFYTHVQDSQFKYLIVDSAGKKVFSFSNDDFLEGQSWIFKEVVLDMEFDKDYTVYIQSNSIDEKNLDVMEHTNLYFYISLE